MSVLTLSFIASFLVNLLIVRFNYLHERFTSDSDFSGIQKFHMLPVPRVGGIAILIGIFAAISVRYFENSEVGMFGFLMLVCSLPVFLSGLLEDLTKKIGIKLRFLAAVISAVLGGYILGGWLTSVQLLGIDNLMTIYPVMAIVITCFSVAGVSNAFNIIDGYNGLSSMTAIIILLGICYVAFKVSDYSIMICALALVGALAGFLIWNYPRGLIFLGDGGAYLIGFWIAELSVLLTARHSEISKWFPLLLCMYPIFETVFSVYRRVIIKNVNPGLPDNCHLHQLIYRRIVRWSIRSNEAPLQIQRNALTAPYLWILCLLAVIPALLFWKYHLLLKLFALIFAIVYVWIYWAIVHFKFPDFLKISDIKM